MTVRSTVIGRASIEVSSGGSESFGPVPAGEVWLIKDARMTQASSGDATVYFYATDASATVLANLLGGASTPPGNYRETPAFLVLVEGDTVEFIVPGGQSPSGPIWVWLSGAKLVL